MKKLYSIPIFMLLFSSAIFANAVASEKQNIRLLNLINQQRMLSQQITKAYIFAKNKIATDKAKKEITTSIQEFQSSYNKATKLTENKKLKQAIHIILKNSTKFNTLSKKPLNNENMKSIINLSESILNQSGNIIQLLEKDIKNKDSYFISLLGQQGMLAQRIAKYYIAYQSNKNKKCKVKMEKSINLFNKNHNKLMEYKKNNPKIGKKLKEIDRLWKIVKEFYVRTEKKIPLIVFETTDEITSKVDELMKLYTIQTK